MSLRLALVACALGLSAWCGTASAEPPWKKLKMFKDVEADPNKDYQLTEDNGPWLITTASFSDKGGLEQAKALVLELRSKYRMKAYLHSKEFDFSNTVRGLHVDKFGKPQKMKYNRPYKAEEYAVLVGDYASAEDPQAQRDLEKIKYIYPDALRPNAAGKSNQQLAWWHNLQRKWRHADVEDGKPKEKPRGPMGRAFITTNPLLPVQFFVTKGVDKLVERMNSGVKYSLLDCPGKYTVQVATFMGKVVIDQDKVKAILESNAPPEGGLVDAAEKAHTVCMKLREKGYEAYEFHDRGMSIVTVGSFDSVGTPLANGKTEINPKIHKIMQTFAATDMQLPGNLQYGKDMLRPVSGRRPKSLAGITLDAQPGPVMVPKKSFSSAFGR
jgi:hypothetical protein